MSISGMPAWPDLASFSFSFRPCRWLRRGPAACRAIAAGAPQHRQSLLGLVELPELDIELAEILVGAEMPGLQREGAVVVLQRQIGLPGLAQAEPHQVERVGVVGLGLDDRGEDRNRITIIARGDPMLGVVEASRSLCGRSGRRRDIPGCCRPAPCSRGAEDQRGGENEACDGRDEGRCLIATSGRMLRRPRL